LNAGDFLDLFVVPEFKSVLKNPSIEKMRSLAKNEEKTTDFGAASYIGAVRSRSAKFTKNSIDHNFDESDFGELKKALDYLNSEGKVIQVDRKIGRKEEFHCRLFVSKKFARVALGWSELLEECDPEREPSMITVMVPEWPVKKILVEADKGITFALGSDYIGEAKKAFLRMWMYQLKKKGWLGLHAGSKLLKLKVNGEVKSFGQLYFGLSATGKSTLTGHGFYLSEPESAEMVQDDVVGLRDDGFCIGTEGKGLFIKTEGLKEEEQPELFHAVTQKNAVLENVWIEENGKVDFFNYDLTSNGRAVIQRSELSNACSEIDIARADQLFFITRNPLMPPIARLDPKKAAVAFMLGESVESSAGDPTKAGQSVRIVGTNPFIMGKPGTEGNMLFEFLKKNTGIECFILNTGFVGEGEKAEKVRVRDSVGFIVSATRKQIDWVFDPDLKLEVSRELIGSKFDPRSGFEGVEYAQRINILRAERKEWLSCFPELMDEIQAELY